MHLSPTLFKLIYHTLTHIVMSFYGVRINGFKVTRVRGTSKLGNVGRIHRPYIIPVDASEEGMVLEVLDAVSSEAHLWITN